MMICIVQKEFEVPCSAVDGFERGDNLHLRIEVTENLYMISILPNHNNDKPTDA